MYIYTRCMPYYIMPSVAVLGKPSFINRQNWYILWILCRVIQI
jgi:hypothetical protein